MLHLLYGSLQDAWLDSVEVDPNFFGTALKNGGNDDDDDGGGGKDLSPEELGAIKRQIADVLEPGETVNSHGLIFVFTEM